VTSFKVVAHRGPAHTDVKFFVGLDVDHLALAGTIKVRNDEGVALWRWLGGTKTVEGVLEPIEVDVARG
jgi:hypothetical protein